MRDSKKITISAITTSLSVALLVFGTFVPIFDLSCVFFCSVLIMIPLYKNTFLGAGLSFLATSLLTLVFCSLNYNVILPYALFFGLHPIVNEWQLKKNLNKYIMFILKAIWFVGAAFVFYFFTELFTDLNDKIVKYIYYIIPIGGVVFFFVYDLCFFYLRNQLNKILQRIGL